MRPLLRTASFVAAVLLATFAFVPVAGHGQDARTRSRPMDKQILTIRKQVYDLTPADLRAFPVWEFALDEEGVEGQDEATVRPMPAASFADPGAGMLIVRASFELADGTKMSGYLTPPAGAERHLGTIQPVIVGPFGQVGFWIGLSRPKPSDLAKEYERLGKTATQVFPVKYRSDVELPGSPVSGTIPGFLSIKSLRDGVKPDVSK